MKQRRLHSRDKRPTKPFPSRVGTYRHALTPLGVLALAKTAEGSKLPYGSILKDILLFGFGSLLKLGELCALRWEDISFKQRTIMISRTTNPSGEVGFLRSSRLIALTPPAESVLKEMRSGSGEQHGPIFLSPGGTQLRPLYLKHQWRGACALHATSTGDGRFARLPFVMATRYAGATFMRNVLDIETNDIEMQLGWTVGDLATDTAPDRRLAIGRILEAWPTDLPQAPETGKDDPYWINPWFDRAPTSFP